MSFEARYNGLYPMAAKPTLEVYYPMIQFLIKRYILCDMIWMASMFKQPSSSVSGQKADDEGIESEGPSLLERMIETLHMELLFVKHRIAVKLANLGREPDKQKKSAKKQKVNE